ncbi:metallophosphoesterase [Candidatus Uabimicrobium amorphum]|nr:metallophosphoesterase [Candidatus Uabimicrobium amorphum]
MKIKFIFLLSLLLFSCSHIYIAPGQKISRISAEHTQTIYIAGDFGSPSSLLKDVTSSIAKDAARQSSQPYILGLGDNLYVKGFPHRDARTSKPFAKLCKIAKLFNKCRYKEQPIPLITIPGNHDYNDDAVSVKRTWGNIAPWYFLRQMAPQSKLFEQWLFMPGDANPHSSASELYEYLYSDLQNLVTFMKPQKIPVENSSTAIIAMDSELVIDLFAAGYYDLAKKYLQSLEEVLRENKNHKWVIVLTHHPLASYAKHRPGKWGSFLLGPGWPQFSKWWHKVLMVPPLGTLTTFGWWAIHYPQDIHSCAYENYRKAVYAMLKDNNVSLVISGHEHCTQLIDLQQTVLNTKNTSSTCMQLVCGEAAKQDPVTNGKGTLFFHTGGGYSQLKFFDKELLIEMRDRQGNQLYNYVINE